MYFIMQNSRSLKEAFDYSKWPALKKDKIIVCLSKAQTWKLWIYNLELGY